MQYYFRLLNYGVLNYGVSFGINLIQGGFYTVFPILLLLLVILNGLRNNNKIDIYMLCMLIGGVGNMVPRIVYGNVWDYVNIEQLGLWINMSDVLISVSAISYILKANGSKHSI